MAQRGGIVEDLVNDLETLLTCELWISHKGVIKVPFDALRAILRAMQHDRYQGHL